MTNAIDLMVQEHDNILKLGSVIHNACCGILEGKEICVEDFEDMILFARTYADKHHHGKEEKILFKEMSAHLGEVAQNLIQHGMLVEHDMGRFHLVELENALSGYQLAPNISDRLEILVNATAWGNLLKRHIDKENNVVYTFAKRSLEQDIIVYIDNEVESFEIQATKDGIQDKSLTLLENLVKKYC